MDSMEDNGLYADSLVARPGRYRPQCRSPVDTAASPAATTSPSSRPTIFQYTTRHPTGLIQHGIRSRLRATHPYLLGRAVRILDLVSLSESRMQLPHPFVSRAVGKRLDVEAQANLDVLL